MHQSQYNPPMPPKTVAVVPTWGHADHLERFLPTVLEQTREFARVVVVGDQGAERVIGDDPSVELRRVPKNLGFAGAVNRGIESALSDPNVDLVAIINDDIALDSQWHACAHDAIRSHPESGSCATCILQLDRPETVASAGIDLHSNGFAFELLNGRPSPQATSPPQDVWGASAAAALYRRELFADVGLFDEGLFAYQEDVELAMRARRAGWKCVMAPAARGFHMGFGSNRPFALGGTYADYFNARNRLVMLLTTLPITHWRRHWRQMVAAQARLMATSVPEGRAGAVWAGVVHGIVRAPRALQRRRRLSETLSRAADRRRL